MSKRAQQQGTEEQPLECRAAFDLTDSGEMMYMPGGIHRVSVSQGDKAVTVDVLVDAQSAAALDAQLAALTARGRKPYFDFGHTNGPASFWPTAFYWSRTPAPGVYVRGEWTETAVASLKAKEWRQFSPVFHVDDTKKNPARIVCREWASPNMGGLVNDPAFHQISPLWARDAGAHKPGDQQQTNNNTENSTMTPEELAALQARNKQLEQEVAALKARENTDATVAAELRAKEAELRAGHAEAETASLKARNAELEASALAAREKVASDAVAAAVARGAIPAKDEALQARWKGLITENPDNAALLASQAGNPALGQRMTGSASRVEMGAVRPAEALKAFGALHARQANAPTMEAKAALAKEAGALYAREISGNKEILDMPLMAADATDANLGILSGTLVAMRTIEDYEQALIAPGMITTDYSDQPAQFGQTTTTRIVVTPAVEEYDPTLDAAGYPKGWVVSTPAQTIDAPVTLNKHKGVSIVFDSNTLGSTVRALFDEQANLAGYALAKDVNDALLAVITAANFPGTVQLKNQPKVVALPDFGRGVFATAASIFNPIGVPIPRRSCLMNSDYFGRLSQDPTLSSLAVYQKPEIITNAELPPISKFQPLEAPNLPTTGDLAAFFMHRSALLVQTRIPNDYTKILPGASFGNVSVITGKTGLSILLVQYVNHNGGYAASRIAIMYGVAKGNAKGGLIIKSK